MTDLQEARVRRRLFGLQLDAMTEQEVVDRAERSIRTRRPMLIGVVNAAKVINLRSDRVLRDSLLECDLLLADGQSVVWASRLLGQPLPERVAGIDLFEHLLALADRQHLAVFLLGARPNVLQAVQDVIAERWPGVRVAGSHDGYFDDGDAPAIAAAIAASGADMLFVAMTSPRKESFLGAHAATMGVPVMHGVGGAFDVLGGFTRRAPARWQRWGLEWLYRVVQEPGRLWKRYLTTNTLFLLLLLRERVRRSHLYTPSTTREDARHE